MTVGTLIPHIFDYY